MNTISENRNPRVRQTQGLKVDNSSARQSRDNSSTESRRTTQDIAGSLADLAARKPGSLGSRTHSDQPNWRPGDDDADELLTQKIQDALRSGASERQLAKLLDIPRTMLWRGKLTSQIPPNLHDRLLKARVAQKQVLTIAKIFRGDDPDAISREIECCPNCGHILRTRSALSQKALAILEQWEADGSPHHCVEQPAPPPASHAANAELAS